MKILLSKKQEDKEKILNRLSRIAKELNAELVDFDIYQKNLEGTTELKDAISFTIKLDRWKINNKLIKPGDIITITSPENYVYKKTRLFIDEVNFKGDSKETTATLKCVLPEVYNKEIPRNIFVDRHENSGLLR